MDHNVEGSQRLTNEDFRKLMMTPRVGSSSSTSASSAASAATPAPSTDTSSTSGQKVKPAFKTPRMLKASSEKAQQRKEKKEFYAKLQQEEDDVLAELAKKYRDRAKERRDGAPEFREDPISAATAYKAVAPDSKSGMDAAERRRLLIQESKFLGGDMEHTHLVKGLDYALLQKVRSEITTVEQDEEDAIEEAAESVDKKEVNEDEEDDENSLLFRTIVGKNIFKTLFQSPLPQRNELFMPGRMAYVIDLEDEFADSDIPTTLIRSKADCPHLEYYMSVSTNDIVINKLAQILSYLRQGGKPLRKAKAKREKNEAAPEKPRPVQDSIYGDIGDYLPSTPKKDSREKERDKGREKEKHREKEREREREKEKSSHRHRDHRERDRKERDREDRERDRDRDRDRDRRSREEKGKERNYFGESEASSKRDKHRSRREEHGEKEEADSAVMREATKTLHSLLKPGSGDAVSLSVPLPDEDGRNQKRDKKLLAKLTEPEGYAECYPGFEEMQEAIDDSDEEVDYTKMDMGNKKGPVGRWDFDTQEEYSDYMNKKEALPKAAFQYGLKMTDGRKTRKTQKDKNDKAHLDREWNKIQQIIQKRKGGGGDDGPEGNPEKIPRM